jgi:hypothetical protein
LSCWKEIGTSYFGRACNSITGTQRAIYLRHPLSPNAGRLFFYVTSSCWFPSSFPGRVSLLLSFISLVDFNFQSVVACCTSTF